MTAPVLTEYIAITSLRSLLNFESTLLGSIRLG